MSSSATPSLLQTPKFIYSTIIFLAAFFSFLGTTTVNRPSFNLAETFSWSISAGKRKLLIKLPVVRSLTQYFVVGWPTCLLESSSALVTAVDSLDSSSTVGLGGLAASFFSVPGRVPSSKVRSILPRMTRVLFSVNSMERSSFYPDISTRSKL